MAEEAAVMAVKEDDLTVEDAALLKEEFEASALDILEHAISADIVNVHEVQQDVANAIATDNVLWPGIPLTYLQSTVIVIFICNNLSGGQSVARN